MDPVPLGSMQQQLGHIRETAKRLTRMVDDLVVDAMNDALDISIRSEPLDVAVLVGDVVASNRPLAERKQQTIFLQGPESVPLSGDQERLREAIDNLVGNAVKYSPVGGRIDVIVAANDREAICSVRDNGPGLSPEDIGRVFGRFQRLSAKPSAGESSTGLGLSIAKRIAELHRGGVAVESPGPGHGATFSLHLPLSKTPHET
jgi:signal transduction histidine kinase